MKNYALLALVFAAACGDPITQDPPGNDSIDAVFGSFDFDHTVGTTECPQDLGDVEVSNVSEDLTVSVLVDVGDGNAVDVIDFGDELGPTEPGELEIVDLLPGESEVFTVWFNCDNDQDFDVDLTLTPDDPDSDPIVIPVTGTFL